MTVTTDTIQDIGAYRGPHRVLVRDLLCCQSTAGLAALARSSRSFTGLLRNILGVTDKEDPATARVVRIGRVVVHLMSAQMAAKASPNAKRPLRLRVWLPDMLGTRHSRYGVPAGRVSQLRDAARYSVTVWDVDGSWHESDHATLTQAVSAAKEAAQEPHTSIYLCDNDRPEVPIDWRGGVR